MINKIHFVGIGGSGISGVASLASKMGYEVSGCDQEGDTAYIGNIQIGHNISHLKNIDLVVTSPALLFSDSKNPEILEAKKLNILMTWQEFLGKILLKNKKIIGVAGTHGKSTTTAMAGKLLEDNGFDPIVVVGASVPEWGGNSRFGDGDYAVVEADEFNNNFLNYHPEIEIINNIEFDHPDFFKNEQEVKESFDKFIDNLVGQKILITQKDNLNIKFNLKIFGEHNQKNANMVFLLGKALGIDDEKITKSIESFNGIGRRMELVCDRKGIKVYDDYAHHPTAIAATLNGAREKYPKAKILVIDEPHGYKRTKTLLKNYKGVFDSADKVMVGPIFQARDEVDTTITAEVVAKAANHRDIAGFESFDKLIDQCRLIINDYDLVVVMGAGKSYRWAKEVASLIPVGFSDVTTFRIGGTIKKYFEVKSRNDVIEAVKFAKNNNLSIFNIGDGTDILASDKDFNGVVVKYVGKQIVFKDDGMVTAESGANWDLLVSLAVDKKLQGIEALSGIPGTVGAAPIQNIGAYGQELTETFVSLDAYDIENEKFRTFSNQDCKFGYRESVFKQKDHWQKFIIISITLKLSKNYKVTPKYESLKRFLTNENPTLKEVREAVLKVRSEKLESTKEVGNAGSFFKNPIIDIKEKEVLESKFPEIKIYPFGDKFKISAGWLIESSGWKGKTIGSAGVSPKHALILINVDGKAKANEILDLSEKIIEDVYKKFGVRLQREVQLINF